MFDLRDTNHTRLRSRDLPGTATEPETLPAVVKGQGDPLDGEDAVQIWQRLLDQYVRELDIQKDNRAAMAVDDDFYDNIQWREDDAKALQERGQHPTVYNVIANSVDWVLGTEKRGRSDFRVLPRRKEDAKPAERKSQILKYLADCNRTTFERSRAFADAVKVGVGWLEDCYDDNDGQEPLTSRYQSWRNMLFDSAAQRLDIEDARYVIRSKHVDLDLAKAVFPKRAGLLDMSARDTDALFMSDEFGDLPMDAAERAMEEAGATTHILNRYVRRRVRMIEMWFKRPQTLPRMQGGTFTGELFDEQSPGHRAEIESGIAQQANKQTLRVWVALFTASGLVYLGPSPYRHNRYPFTPVWGNRRGRDGLPYGMIRRLKDIQESINKRASKALYHISTRRVIAEEGAAEDMDELFEEAAKTDARIVVKPGKKVIIEDGRELAMAELELMSRDIAMVEASSGVTNENLGRQSNAKSGIAIERKQNQGSLATTHYFDNLRFAYQVQGEKQLSLIEQFMVEEKQFRITNMRGKPEYITVNDGLPENDIARCKADYVISEADWRNSMREAAAAQLLDLAAKLAPVQPQLVVLLVDLLVEEMDIANREEIVRRIREITGMRDPDAEELTPEEQARAAAQAEEKKLAKDAAVAEVRKKNADAAAAEAKAKETQAKTALTNVHSIGGTKRGAIDIAADLMTQPGIAGPADEILRDVGFVGRTELEQTAAGLAAEAQQQAMQAQQQQPPDAGMGQQAPGLTPPPPQGA